MAPQPPQATQKFTFTKRQNDFLKPNLPDYMQALYGENSDEKCKEFIDRMFANLRKEYDFPDTRKDAIILVRMLTLVYLTWTEYLMHTLYRPSTSFSRTRRSEQRRRDAYRSLYELLPVMNSTGTTGSPSSDRPSSRFWVRRMRKINIG